LLARELTEIGACVGEPARARRAVYPIEAREVVDRQLVEDVLAEQGALAPFERGERLADRLLQLGGVFRAPVLLLGARRRIGPMIEQDLVERLLAIDLTDDLERLARRAHAQPRGKLAAARVVCDPAMTIGADQQLEAQRLLHFIGRAARETQP